MRITEETSRPAFLEGSHDVGSRQKMTEMDSKRATSKCIATALVCQPCWVCVHVREQTGK